MYYKNFHSHSPSPPTTTFLTTFVIEEPPSHQSSNHHRGSIVIAPTSYPYVFMVPVNLLHRSLRPLPSTLFAPATALSYLLHRNNFQPLETNAARDGLEAATASPPSCLNSCSPSTIAIIASTLALPTGMKLDNMLFEFGMCLE